MAIDDLNGGSDDNSRHKSLVHGEPPVTRVCCSFAEEVRTIADWVGSGEAARTCLVTRTHSLLEHYEAALGELGIETCRLHSSEVEDHDAPGLRLATMHRVKGLEFDRLVIAGVNDDVVPLTIGELSSDDSAVREEAEKRERALFYVAVTRARREVLITSHGAPNPWMNGPADRSGP